jgi:hypothetical protein
MANPEMMLIGQRDGSLMCWLSAAALVVAARRPPSRCRLRGRESEGHQFRGRRFIDVNTTASKNELTSTYNNWRIFVYIYPRTNSTKLWRISCAAPATL